MGRVLNPWNFRQLSAKLLSLRFVELALLYPHAVLSVTLWSLSHLYRVCDRDGGAVLAVDHTCYGRRWLVCEGNPELLFTENETNYKRLFGVENSSRYVKDGINDYIVNGEMDAVNAARQGTKASAHYQTTIAAGSSASFRLRFTNQVPTVDML